MGKTESSRGDALTPTVARRIDQVCNHFEQAWRTGKGRPRIEDFLDGMEGPERLALVRQLVLLDIDYRRRHHQTPRAEDYARFPELPATWLAGAVSLSQTVGADPAATQDGDKTSVLPLEVGGQRLGDYELESEIARGGMGVVYRARQKSLGRTVALKMILAGGHADQGQLARFRTEAEAIARLQHPHIVQVFEVGEHEGLPFFSLEYCPGGSLATHLHGTPLPPREAASLVEILAETIHAAHQKGIVHRDLKPANILLQRDESEATELTSAMLKITDFGLAKRVEDVGQTASGVVMGTPSYMAPEQAKGDNSHVGPAADIYAVGAILYELLTGRPPFRAATTLDTILQVVCDEPVPPRRLQPRTPRDLETICLKCLHKDASRRYPRAADLAADLGRWLRDEPIRARPVGGIERAAKWVRRRPATAALLAITALLPLVALALAGWYLEREHQFNQDLQEERNSALQQKGIAEENEAEANTQKKRAQDAYRESQLRLMQMHVAHGVRLMEDGDSFAALPWLVAALKEDPREQAAREMHRYRLGVLLRYSPKLTRMLFHPANVVHHVEFNPDGSRLLTTCDDQRVRLWNLATGKEVFSDLSHANPMTTTRMFSSDGSRIVTVGNDHRVHVWDAATGKSIQTIASMEGAVRACFCPDGRRLLVIAERVARVFDAGTGEAVTPAFSHADQILDASFSPDGRWIATASKDATVGVWDAVTGKALAPSLKHEHPVNRLAISPDSKYLATTSQDSRLRLWTVAAGEGRLAWEATEAGSAEVHFSPDGSRLISCDSMWAELRDARTGTRIARLRHNGAVYRASFSPDGQRAATSSEDMTARVWDATTGLPVTPPLRHSWNPLEMAFSPDGRWLATGCYDGAARVWDLGSVKPLPGWTSECKIQALSSDSRFVVAIGKSDSDLLVLHSERGESAWGAPWRLPSAVRYASFSPDSRLVVVVCKDRTARLREIGSRKELCPPLKHDSDLLMAEVSADATRLATGCQDGTVHVWDVVAGQEIYPPLRHTGAVDSIRFSADSRRLLTSGKDFRARLWDALTGQPLGPFVTHSTTEYGLWRINTGGPAWRNGDNLLACVLGFEAQGWDATTGKPAGPALQHSGGLASLTFSLDGSRLLTGSNDCTAQQWDVSTGKRLSPSMRHNGFVRYATYSPDGRRIASTEDNAVRLWDATTGLLLAPLLMPATHAEDIRFSPDGQRLFQWYFNDGHMFVWDVSREERPVEDLERLAYLLSAHEVDDYGGMTPLSREAIRKLWHELEAKYPDGFDRPPERDRQATWHLRQAEKARIVGSHPAVLSH